MRSSWKDLHRFSAIFSLLLLVTGCFPVSSSSIQVSDACEIDTPAVANPDFNLELVTEGLSSPVFLTDAQDGTERLFIVEQSGTIRILENGTLLTTPFLDIRDRTRARGEQGLLSAAFHPDYAENGKFFVDYTRASDGATILAEFTVGANPNVADAASERMVLQIPQPFGNHNGGLALFGPDGYLYIGMGDGGSGGDPQGNGQNLSTLLGALLRIDVNKLNGQPYGIPPDNPFLGTANAREEIFAYGFRNPWRFAFDRCNGRLFLGDVGQSRYEEIDEVEPGGNYGWNILEGAHCFQPSSGCNMPGIEPPIAEYSHDGGHCSVTGGAVYRGNQAPELVGHYLFGDYCSGQVWSLIRNSGGQWVMTALADVGFNISSFGEDSEGTLYLIDHGGRVYRVMD